ncbi:MAG: 6-hydroxymethylpterin diphosphokinase MptE-like protein [Candidatus Caldarchaeales archaeon]
MTPSYWKAEYARIVDELGIDPEGDRRASEFLSRVFRDAPCVLRGLSGAVGRKLSIVVGASDNVHEDLRSLEHVLHGFRDDVYLVSADSATPALLGAGLVPDAVVTDLDCPEQELLKAYSRGSFFFVHGHGDNLDALSRLTVKLRDRAEPTCQVPDPVGHVHNFGGFTDGDRAVHVASALGCRTIVLVGMCLSCDVSELSSRGKPRTASWFATKSRKLEIAKRLLLLHRRHRPDVSVLQCSVRPDPGLPFPNVDPDSLLEIVRHPHAGCPET